jgi:hypothetical protein
MIAWRNPNVRKPTTLHDTPLTLREWVGVWLARRIVAEYQDELSAWIMRADAGWQAAVESRADIRRLRLDTPPTE